jgi:hypothetical protein
MEQLTNDFGLAYATVLTKIFNQWMHDEDSGCDYDAIGQRQVYLFNNIMAIFQPKGCGEGWIEEASLIFTLSKDGKAAGHKLNEAALRRFGPIIETVNKKLYESWTTFVSSRNNKWMETMDKPTFATSQDFVNALCGFTKPLTFEKGVIKFSYQIKYWYMELSIPYWHPVELIKWSMESPSYDAYKAAMWARKEKEYRETYDYSEELITTCREEYMSKELPKYLDDEEYEEYLQTKGTVCVIPVLGKKRKLVSDEEQKEEHTTKKARKSTD